jgi:hypothetical protein
LPERRRRRFPEGPLTTDRHLEGLFPRSSWVRNLTAVGYQVELFARPLDDEGATDQVFLCRRER